MSVRLAKSGYTTVTKPTGQVTVIDLGINANLTLTRAASIQTQSLVRGD